MDSERPIESHILFAGPGPFQLPPATTATASACLRNEVTVTLYSVLPSRSFGQPGPRVPEPLTVGMTSSLARRLAAQLIEAAERAERL